MKITFPNNIFCLQWKLLSLITYLVYSENYFPYWHTLFTVTTTIYIFCCILNHSALRQLNGLMTVIASLRTSQCREAQLSLKKTKTKLATPHAHGGSKASIEACSVDLGDLERHNCSIVAWRGFSVNSYTASPLRPVSRLAVIVPSQCWTASKL